MLNQELLEKICLLHFDVLNKQNICINHHVIKINTTSHGALIEKRLGASKTESLQFGNVQANTDFPDCKLKSFIQQGPLMRVGRKTSMSEDARIPDKVIKNYLALPKLLSTLMYGHKDSISKHYLYENPSITVRGNIDYSLLNGGVKIDFTMKPEQSGKILLEAGIAFLLDSAISQVQWLGNGLYASYPGKMSANNYGLYSLSSNDIYFEGNRMGVDMVLCTNVNGDGVLLVCKDGKINFERTDKGIVLSFNTHVSGLGGKLRPTSFPVYADKIGAITGSFSLYYVDGNNWNPLLKDLFVSPNEVKKAFIPFISAYDTYLKKFNDMVYEQNVE
jgi:beta-galactosidase